MRKVIPLNTVICAATFLASCGGNGPTEAESGSFIATVSGDVNVSLIGQATFFDGGVVIWLLHGSFSGRRDFIRFDRRSGAAPGVGTFTIAGIVADPDDFVAEYEHAREGADGIETTRYGSVSGSLTITSATADRIEGSFSFKGIGLGIGRTVTVEGSFDAKPEP